MVLMHHFGNCHYLLKTVLSFLDVYKIQVFILRIDTGIGQWCIRWPIVLCKKCDRQLFLNNQSCVIRNGVNLFLFLCDAGGSRLFYERRQCLHCLLYTSKIIWVFVFSAHCYFWVSAVRLCLVFTSCQRRMVRNQIYEVKSLRKKSNKK